MTKDAFLYAFAQVPIPEGRLLSLYMSSPPADGEVYTPMHGECQSLKAQGYMVHSDKTTLARDYDAVLLACPKQREETEGLIALALERSKGMVMAVAPNDAGGGRLLRLFESYGVECHSLSKFHSKIVWTRQAAQADANKLKEGLKWLEPMAITLQGRSWWTVPGLFGWNKVDEGSALLTRFLPASLHGRVADWGCGYGYLTAFLLEHAPAISAIDAYDVDARALEVISRNVNAKVAALWQDMRTYQPTAVYDAVVMNPPFHDGKEEDIGLGRLFIRKAWESLKKGGVLYMVANRKLPYEDVVPGIRVLHSEGGYKIMMGQKA